MTSNANNDDMLSTDYYAFTNDTMTLIYRAIPRGDEITCEGPAAGQINHELSSHIHDAASRIMLDVLSKGKARWCLNINPVSSQNEPFCFRPKADPIPGFKTVPFVIHSRDVGISGKHIRSLSKRLRHSHMPLHGMASLLRYDRDRKRIADRWGHSLSWHISDWSAFTDSCFLLNECSRKLLAIRLCETIAKAMNEALCKSELAAYTIKIPTCSREKLESSKQEYIEGRISSKEFRELVLLRL